METIQMQYKITGAGQPLVLVPGGLTGWASWDPFVEEFSASNKVIQVQLISVEFGLENEDLPVGYSVRLESDALAASLNEAGITAPSDFIGWSFGAFVLLDFALNHPEQVRSLTLIEPPAFWILKAQAQPNAELQNSMDFLKSLTGDISESQLETFMLNVGLAPPGTSVKDHPQWDNWVKYRRSLRNSRMVIMHDDDLSRLNGFDKSVLLVKGTGSAPFLHEIIDLLYQHLPRAKVVELAGGHAPHIVSRKEFMQMAGNLRK